MSAFTSKPFLKIFVLPLLPESAGSREVIAPSPLLCLLLLRLRFRVWQRAKELSLNVSLSSACTLTKRLYALILYIKQFEGYSLLLGCHIPLSIS